jgi:hypothetical protein
MMTDRNYLLDNIPNVPMVKRPIYWVRDLPVSTNLNTLQLWVDEYKKWLPKGGAFIDEVSVLAPGGWQARKFVDNMVAHGWEQFNEASDIVFTNPFSTRYFVRYKFLRHPDWEWRIEVMFFDFAEEGVRGFSPLHQALWLPDGTAPATTGVDMYPVPHLSFKVTPVNGEQNPRASFSRAVGHLQERGFIHAQTCQSTYGVFGYYLPQDAERQLYLKPRLNLRDLLAECGKPKPCEHNPDGGNHPVVKA